MFLGVETFYIFWKFVYIFWDFCCCWKSSIIFLQKISIILIWNLYFLCDGSLWFFKKVVCPERSQKSPQNILFVYRCVLCVLSEYLGKWFFHLFRGSHSYVFSKSKLIEELATTKNIEINFFFWRIKFFFFFYVYKRFCKKNRFFLSLVISIFFFCKYRFLLNFFW